VSTSEIWPDGQTYLVTAGPIPTYRNLPSFGWSILAQQRADLALGPARVFTPQTLLLFIAVASLLGLMSLVAGCALGRPLARLTAAATALVHGARDQPIPEETRYREAALLSAALVRVQSIALSNEAPAASGTGEPRRQNVA
jgi:hypothetical protein